jgi:hypothetical protein
MKPLLPAAILALAVSAGAAPDGGQAHAQSLEDSARAAYDKAAKEWARQAEEKRKIRLEQENCYSKGTPCVAVGPCERPCKPGPILGPNGISGTQLNAIIDARSAGFMRWLERGINPEGWAALLAHAPRSRSIDDRRGIRAWHRIYYRYADVGEK